MEEWVIDYKIKETKKIYGVGVFAVITTIFLYTLYQTYGLTIFPVMTSLTFVPMVLGIISFWFATHHLKKLEEIKKAQAQTGNSYWVKI
jgi:uncharacterized membrane protein